eukprot:UN03769
MKTLYTNDIIDLFYIVTSDSDFRHVFPYIRETGKLIHVIGSENADISLKNCDRFTKVEILRSLEPQKEIIYCKNESIAPESNVEALRCVAESIINILE